MAKNKISIDFKGYDLIKKQLDELGGNATKRAIEGTLKASQQVVAEQVSAALEPHVSGKKGESRTKQSIIRNMPVEWAGDEASIAVGFDINNGGLASIFLMYGTELFGQPHITPDTNLYNAVYGAQTKKKIKEMQEQAFLKVLERLV